MGRALGTHQDMQGKVCASVAFSLDPRIFHIRHQVPSPLEAEMVPDAHVEGEPLAQECRVAAPRLSGSSRQRALRTARGRHGCEG